MNAVIASLKDNQNCNDKIFLMTAPTGKASAAINGSIIHSHKEVLGIAVEVKHKKLEGNALKHMQENRKVN